MKTVTGQAKRPTKVKTKPKDGRKRAPGGLPHERERGSAGPTGEFSIGKLAVVLVLLGGIGIIGFNVFKQQPNSNVAVVEPATLSTVAAEGKRLFDANCAACHGVEGGGTEKGPPFVSDIYNPGHHADEAFFLAVRYGARAHHWRFGNMPPVQGVTDAEVRAIVKYVREIQEANGILYRPHTM